MSIIRAGNPGDYEKIEKLAFEIIPDFYSDVIPHDHNFFLFRNFKRSKPFKNK